MSDNNIVMITVNTKAKIHTKKNIQGNDICIKKEHGKYRTRPRPSSKEAVESSQAHLLIKH